jgi:hypothetical protein
LQEFGSKGRGDSDYYSDKDILLVGNNVGYYQSFQKNLRIKGYSVCCINFEKASYSQEMEVCFLNISLMKEKLYLATKLITIHLGSMGTKERLMT